MNMDIVIRGWIIDILQQHEELLAIAIRQRAKFEGWLKFELAAHAERNGATQVQVEVSYPDATIGLRRSDLSFYFNGERYDIELKTPNTSWRLPGVVNKICPITLNITEIVQDGKKLARSSGQGIVAIVMFPIPPQDPQWTTYLQQIATKLNTLLTGQDHATQMAMQLSNRYTADVVVCCFAIPKLLPSIPTYWLVHKIGKRNPKFVTAVNQLRPVMQEGDELWFYDEPAPPDVNAGELGVALVRNGIPIASIVCGIH